MDKTLLLYNLKTCNEQFALTIDSEDDIFFAKVFNHLSIVYTDPNATIKFAFENLTDNKIIYSICINSNELNIFNYLHDHTEYENIHFEKYNSKLKDFKHKNDFKILLRFNKKLPYLRWVIDDNLVSEKYNNDYEYLYEHSFLSDYDSIGPNIVIRYPIFTGSNDCLNIVENGTIFKTVQCIGLTFKAVCLKPFIPKNVITNENTTKILVFPCSHLLDNLAEFCPECQLKIKKYYTIM